MSTIKLKPLTKSLIVPGSQLFVGPWTHGGITNNPVGHDQKASRSNFDQIGHILQFLEEALRCIDGSQAHLESQHSSNGRFTAAGSQLEKEASQRQPQNPGKVKSYESSHEGCNGSGNSSHEVSEGRWRQQQTR